MRWTYILLVLSVWLLACNEREEAWKADLDNPFPEARMAALRRMMEKARPEDLEYWASAARDSAPGVRRVAAEGLGKSRSGHALDLLNHLLMDADEKVQAAAALAMGHHRGEKARKYLLLRFPQSPQPVRHAIVQALKTSGLAEPMKQAMRFEARELWEKTRQMLVEPPSLAQQVSAAIRLSESGREEAIGLLLPLLKEKTPVLVAAAVEGLANLGAHTALSDLEALVLSSHADIQKAAIAAVASLQATQSIPLLIRLATAKEAASNGEEAALWALEGLQRFPSSPEVDEAMCKLAVSPGSPLLRSRAALALAQRAPCEPKPLFEQLADPSLAEAALWVLAHWPESWSREANKVWALIKSANLGLSTLAAHVLSEAYVQGKIEEKPPLYAAYIEERVVFLKKKEEGWIKFPLEEGFGTEIPLGDDEREELRQRQKLLLRGVLERNHVLLEEMGQQASTVLLPPELAEELSLAELRQLAAFLKLGRFLRPQQMEAHLRSYAGASEAFLRAAALGALVGMGPAHWGLAQQGIFDSKEVGLLLAEAFVQEGAEGEKHLLAALGKRAEDSSALLELLSCKELEEEGFQVLLTFLERSIQEASLATRCLGRAKYPGARERLMGRMEGATVEERKHILEALREMEAKEAREEIEAQLLHESPEVREAAVRALGHLGVGDSKEMIEALGEDYFQRIRQMALATFEREN